MDKIVVVVICSTRPKALRNHLEQLVKYRPSKEKFPIVISQDGNDNDVTKVAQEYESEEMQIQFVHHKERSGLDSSAYKEAHSYFLISQHYKWTLNKIFKEFKYPMAIITEDDLDIAEDFFDYFLATAPLLKLDRTVWCISAYNDNGATTTTDRNRTDLFYRTDFFPGLGWLLTSELWDELSPIWPDAYWDDWLRKQEIRKNRVCIRPEISRTSHNMQLAGNGSSRGLFGKFLSSIRLAEKPYNFSNYNVNNLYKESYDVELGKKLTKTQFIDVYDINEGMRPNATFEYRIEYKNQAQFRRIARMFKLMLDFRSGMPRNAYYGVVPFVWNGVRFYAVPSNLNVSEPFGFMLSSDIYKIF